MISFSDFSGVSQRRINELLDVRGTHGAKTGTRGTITNGNFDVFLI